VRQPGEEQALDFLLERRRSAGAAQAPDLRLRPHDSDPPDRWDAWIAASRSETTCRWTQPTLADALDRVAWVAGLESTALVTAQATGRRAVCLQPPWAPRATAAAAGLIHLRDLVQAAPPPP
jgi:hypothetical protein